MPLPSGAWFAAAGCVDRYRTAPPWPEFWVYLFDKRPEPVSWDVRWVRWPDFRLPADRRDAHDALHEAWRCAANERVEVACGGGSRQDRHRTSLLGGVGRLSRRAHQCGQVPDGSLCGHRPLGANEMIKSSDNGADCRCQPHLWRFGLRSV